MTTKSLAAHCIHGKNRYTDVCTVCGRLGRNKKIGLSLSQRYYRQTRLGYVKVGGCRTRQMRQSSTAAFDLSDGSVRSLYTDSAFATYTFRTRIHTQRRKYLSLRAYVMRSGQESFHVGFCARDRCARAVILWIRVTPDRYIITASHVVARGTGKKTRVASVQVRGGEKRGRFIV